MEAFELIFEYVKENLNKDTNKEDMNEFEKNDDLSAELIEIIRNMSKT